MIQSTEQPVPEDVWEDGVVLTLSLRSELLDHPPVPDDMGIRVREEYAAWIGQLARRPEVVDQAERLRGGPGLDVALSMMPRMPAECVLEAALVLSVCLALDDVIDRDAVSAGDFAAVARGDEIPCTGFLEVFREVTARARALLGADLYSRWLRHFTQWVGSDPRQGPARPPRDLSEYLERRYEDFGLSCAGVFVEYGSGATGALAPSASLDGLHAACYEHTALVNDLFSYRKEWLAGEDTNALIVLPRSQGGELQAVVDEVCERINQAESSFAVHARDLLATAGEESRQAGAYVRGWRDMLSGNLVCSMTTPRYHGPGMAPPERMPQAMILHRDRTAYRW